MVDIYNSLCSGDKTILIVYGQKNVGKLEIVKQVVRKMII